MTQFAGSLRFVQLPAVVQLLSELASTGRLCVTYAEWSGEILVREGQIVAASLGSERGRAALEAIAVALPDGRFSFVDEPLSDTSEVLVDTDERVAYLNRLHAEHERLSRLIPSLNLIPRLVEARNGDAPETQVTIEASALQFIPALVLGHSLEHLARQRGLARTVREVAVLIKGGVVELAPPSSNSPADPVVDKPAPVPVQPFSARIGDRRFAPRQRADAPPVAVPSSPGRHVTNAPRPAVAPSAIAERMAAFTPVLAHPVAQPSSTPPRAAWHKAIVGFFIHDEQ